MVTCVFHGIGAAAHRPWRVGGLGREGCRRVGSRPSVASFRHLAVVVSVPDGGGTGPRLPFGRLAQAASWKRLEATSLAFIPLMGLMSVVPIGPRHVAYGRSIPIDNLSAPERHTCQTSGMRGRLFVKYHPLFGCQTRADTLRSPGGSALWASGESNPAIGFPHAPEFSAVRVDGRYCLGKTISDRASAAQARTRRAGPFPHPLRCVHGLIIADL